MKRILLVAAAGVLLLAGGCGQGEEEPDAVIGVSVLTFANPFFNELSGAIVDEAAKHNYKVIVVDGNEDVVLQDRQVDDFITQQVDAIVLCPCNAKSIGSTIVKANKAGIPVFTADTGSLSDQGKVVCHVATANEEGGRKAAEAVIEMLDGKGKVAVLDYPEVESVRLRTKGFKEVMSGAPGIEVVGYWPGGGERKKSSGSAEDVLENYQDLDGFFCINDPSAMGAINAVEKLRKADQVKIVGFDAQLEARRAVRDGRMYATIVQYPEQIGSTVADRVHQHLIGEEVEREILIPVKIYRKADGETDPRLEEASGP